MTKFTPTTFYTAAAVLTVTFGGGLAVGAIGDHLRVTPDLAPIKTADTTPAPPSFTRTPAAPQPATVPAAPAATKPPAAKPKVVVHTKTKTVIKVVKVKPFGFNPGDCPQEDSCYPDYLPKSDSWVIKRGERPRSATKVAPSATTRLAPQSNEPADPGNIAIDQDATPADVTDPPKAPSPVEVPKPPVPVLDLPPSN
jgi:hypothetical protein